MLLSERKRNHFCKPMMHSVLFFAQCLSILAFMSYGVACFYSPSIEAEFLRYRLPQLRKLTGALEIAGAIGLTAGFFYDPLRVLSAGCLVLLMIFAIIARIRINDSFLAMLPAIILLILNIFIGVTSRSQEFVSLDSSTYPAPADWTATNPQPFEQAPPLV